MPARRDGGLHPPCALLQIRYRPQFKGRGAFRAGALDGRDRRTNNGVETRFCQNSMRIWRGSRPRPGGIPVNDYPGPEARSLFRRSKFSQAAGVGCRGCRSAAGRVSWAMPQPGWPPLHPALSTPRSGEGKFRSALAGSTGWGRRFAGFRCFPLLGRFIPLLCGKIPLLFRVGNLPPKALILQGCHTWLAGLFRLKKRFFPAFSLQQRI
jgi:hypothetical protein